MATSGSWYLDCTTGLYGQDSGARFQLRFNWTQSYVTGGSSSTIAVSAKLVCTTYKYAVNAAWWKNGTGNITITAGGITLGSWEPSTQLTTTALTYQGQVLWSVDKAFTLNTSAASSFVIAVTGGLFINTGSTSNSITFPTTSSTQYTNAIPQPTPYYTVSISQGTGSWVSVTANGSAVSSGASLIKGTTLTATFGANTGYNSPWMTVDGTGRSSGYQWTLNSNTSVSTGATINSYTVYYNANGGSGAPSSQTKTYGQTIYLSSTKPSWTGHTFQGWATSASGGVSYNPGSAYSANASITLYAVWTVNTFVITISQGAGTWLSVKNGSTTISNGQSVAYGTVLTATFGANTGYTGASMTVGGTARSSGFQWTVTSAITVASSASVLSYTLYTSCSNSSVSIYRSSSSKAGAAVGYIGNGATIYYSDVLKITATPNNGFGNIGLSLNDAAFGNGANHTVTSNVTVKTWASVLSYTLYINKGANTTLNVDRMTSPYGSAPTGGLGNGSVIYYGDTLKVIASASTDYNLSSLTWNGSPIASGTTMAVTSNVTVASVASQTTYIYTPYVGNESEGFDYASCYIWDGTQWLFAQPQIFDGVKWV